MSTEWILPAGLTESWKFSYSARGWTSDIHGLKWMRRCFELATREKANGEYRLLVLDGHGSHITPDFIGHAMFHKILYCVFQLTLLIFFNH